MLHLLSRQLLAHRVNSRQRSTSAALRAKPHVSDEWNVDGN
jgi:hypothetical protein